MCVCVCVLCVCERVCVCVRLHVCVVCMCVCVCVRVCFSLSQDQYMKRLCLSLSLFLSVLSVRVSVSLCLCLTIYREREREKERERERLCPVVIQFHACAGIFKHSQSFSKTYLADLVPEQERSSVLGHFNASSNIGFILGPVVGGHLAELPGGFQYVACISGGVFWINAGEVYCCC